MESNYTHRETNQTNTAVPNPEYVLSYTVAFGVLGLVTILGNSLVLMSFKINPRVCIKENYFLLSLSTADILTGLVVIPLYIYLLYPSNLSMLLIRIYTGCDVICGVSSIMNLVCLSIVRCWGVVEPLKQRGHRERVYSIVATVVPWGTAIISTPGFLLLWHGLDDRMVYPIQVAVCYFIPLVVIVICYIIISYIFCKRDVTHSDCNTFQKNRQVTKMLAIVIGLFLVTWLPFFTLGLMQRYLPDNQLVRILSKQHLFKILKLLQYTNSAVNPAVYALKIPEIKISFVIIYKRLLTGKPMFSSPSYDERTCIKITAM